MKRSILLLIISLIPAISIFARGDYKAVYAGQRSFFVLKNDGSLWSWGDNNFCQLGDGTRNNRSKPAKILDNVVKLTNNGVTFIALLRDGSLWGWGHNHCRELCIDKEYITRPVKIMEGFKDIAIGNEITLGLTEDNSVIVWGTVWEPHFAGEIPAGFTLPREVYSGRLRKVATAYFTSFMIRDDNSLWGWGDNRLGSLGDGNIKDYNPKSVGNAYKILDNVKDVVTHNPSHTMAICYDGTLWGWGFNKTGAIGDGTYTNHPRPVKIMDSVKKVALGNGYTFAIRLDGSLWAWGENDKGQLGDGTKITRNRPVKIADNVTDVACCQTQTIYLTSSGELMVVGEQ